MRSLLAVYGGGFDFGDGYEFGFYGAFRILGFVALGRLVHAAWVGSWRGDGRGVLVPDPTNLAVTQSVIVVSVNYRVLTFGFMALPELFKESGALNREKGASCDSEVLGRG